LSDTQSLKSEDSTVTTNGGASIFVEIESVGKLSLADSSAARVSTASQPYPGGPDQKKFAIQDGLIGKDPSSIYSWSISHILTHEFFCLGNFGSYG
jgi:hypothetical protein